MLGLRRHLSRHRAQLRRRPAIVLGIGGCATGRPLQYVSDGPLVPLPAPPRLRALARELGAAPHRDRGTGPAHPARLARLAALTIGAGVDPRPGPEDPSEPDPASALDATLELALTLVDAIDAELARGPQR
jgi:hypothetical protein